MSDPHPPQAPLAAAAPPAPDPLRALLHELDTPLGVALTAASVQQMQIDTLVAHATTPRDDPVVARALRDLLESTRLMRNGLDRAIAILGARKAARRGQPAGAADALKLSVVLGDALSVPMFRFGERIAECALEVDDGLVVQTEPNAWYQVIANLVANSALHGFVGKESPGRIVVSARRLGADRICVVYRDNGRGFSAHARACAFVRQYSSRLGAGSSGLGLSIIRDIVRERLHGTITLLDSAEGAAFGIEFPIRPPAAEAALAP